MAVKSSSNMRPGVSSPNIDRSPTFTKTPPLTLPPKPVIPPTKMSDFALQGKEETTPVDDNGEVLDSSWERIELPSKFVFYPWQDVSIKRFGVMDQAKLFRAVRHRNITLLLDVLSSTCNRDVREMSYGDFQALCIWHSLNSYLNSKQVLTWGSKYGVTGKADIKKIIVKESPLEATREEYLKWKERGLAMSTCRDMELMASKTLVDEEILYLFDKAQFIDVEPLKQRVEELQQKGDLAATATARIEKVAQLGLNFFPVLDEFAEKFSDYGIQRIASVMLNKTDFNYDKAIEALSQSDTPEDQEEYNKLMALGPDVDYQPQTEEVPLSFEMWSMFQYT